LAYFLYKINKSKNTESPGKEILLPGYINPNDPFTHDAEDIGNPNQA